MKLLNLKFNKGDFFKTNLLKVIKLLFCVFLFLPVTPIVLIILSSCLTSNIEDKQSGLNRIVPTEIESENTDSADVQIDEETIIDDSPEDYSNVVAVNKIPAKLPQDISEGALVTSTPDGKILTFPLKHTDVSGKVTGFIAHFKVTHTFENPFDVPCEAIYIFPLPNKAAVFDMKMKIGKRIISSQIKRRQEARQIYEKARDEGHVASLLEQERPNIFTQSVANIIPGKSIQVTIEYIEDLKYEDGQYELVFPMVVGPRYIPGTPLNNTPQGRGWSPDTTQVSDASNITPPVLPPSFRSAHDISLSVTIDAGVSIKSIQSKSHEIEIQRINNSKSKIKIKASDSIPNRDFILDYAVKGSRIESALLTHASKNGKFFMLIMQPPEMSESVKVVPKEMIFVIDESGSMSGYPIETSKQAMRYAIQNMNPQDTFQLIRFSNGVATLSSQPIENSQQNIQDGLNFINLMNGDGGTEMLPAILTALNQTPDPERLRIVLLLTDGYIGNENEIFNAVDKNLGNARMFSLGIGSAVNHYLLDKIAETGRGDSQFVTTDENPEKVVSQFYDRISHPLLTDISIDWDGINVSEVYPSKIQDLFSSRPLIVFGKYQGSSKSTIKVQGKQGDKITVTEMPVVFPEDNNENYSIVNLWARNKIDDLSSQMYQGEVPEIVEQITQTALNYRLSTKYTSFVAVEERITVDNAGQAKSIIVPVEIPKNVSYKGIFGDSSLSPAWAMPGDPEIRVPASQNAKAVTVILPFGETNAAQWDPFLKLWNTRFLIPRDTQPGSYPVRVIITEDDGTQNEQTLWYTVDSVIPLVNLVIEGEARAGNEVILHAKQVITDLDLAQVGLNREKRISEKTLQNLNDTRRVEVRTPDGQVIRLISVEPGEWEGRWQIPDNCNGRITLFIVAVDLAGNVSTDEFDLDVL